MEEEKIKLEGYMRLALEEASQAFLLGEVPIGAVVVRRGHVLGRAGNRRETWRDPTAHAEILAMRKAAAWAGGWRLSDCQLYVTIEPCAMCAGALIQARIDKLIYGAPDSKAGAVHSALHVLDWPHFNHRVKVTGNILAGECAGLMQQFFGQVRERNKSRRDG